MKKTCLDHFKKCYNLQSNTLPTNNIINIKIMFQEHLYKEKMELLKLYNNSQYHSGKN